MKSFLTALPVLESQGYSVESWCSSADADLTSHVTLRLPLWHLPSPINFWIFTLEATLAHLVWKICSTKEDRERTLFVSFGCYSLLAPIAFIHFSQLDWIRCLQSLPVKSLRDLYELLTRYPSVALEWLHQRSPFVKRYVVVSTGVAQEYEKAGVRASKLLVLPNTFDETRFCLPNRTLYRERARQNLGFRETDIAFCFCSMGHFRRKGLDLVFQALQLVRNEGLSEVKLVLIGGNSQKVAEAKEMAAAYCRGDLNWIRFLGHQDRPEKHMAGCEALILPSRSESFGLVSLEALSLGLRLYLTQHHGSEMMLVEGVNGRMLDWGAEDIASVLIEEIRSGAIWKESHSVGKALTGPAYARQLADSLVLPA